MNEPRSSTLACGQLDQINHLSLSEQFASLSIEPSGIGLANLAGFFEHQITSWGRLIWANGLETEKWEQICSRIALNTASFYQKPTAVGAVIFLLQLATEFGLTPVYILRQLFSLLTNAAECPTQLYQGTLPVIRRLMAKAMSVFTGDVTVGAPEEIEMQVFQDGQPGEGVLPSAFELDAETIAAIASLAGGLAVIVGTAIVGLKSYSGQRGFLSGIAEFSGKLTKLKNGTYAVIAIIRDFSSFVKEVVLNYYQGTPAASVVRAVESLEMMKEGVLYTAEQLMTDLTRLNSDDGEQVMATDHVELRNGIYAQNVLQKIQTETMIGGFKIPPQIMTILAAKYREFSIRIKSASVKQNVGAVRFTPFSIWLYGAPKVGKSQTMSKLPNDMMRALEKINAEKYEIPSADQWQFSANFTQDYHTGYNGQYVFKMDDMCQDKAGTLNTSSALQFINWVSPIPANVTQAAVEDKKCPFRSKIMMATSNEGYPNRTHEIYSNDAFLRRRNILVHCEKSNTNDPDLRYPIKFTRMDPMKNEVIKVYSSYQEMGRECVREYQAHFDEQTRLIKMADDVTDLCDEPVSGEAPREADEVDLIDLQPSGNVVRRNPHVINAYDVNWFVQDPEPPVPPVDNILYSEEEWTDAESDFESYDSRDMAHVEGTWQRRWWNQFWMEPKFSRPEGFDPVMEQLEVLKWQVPEQNDSANSMLWQLDDDYVFDLAMLRFHISLPCYPLNSFGQLCRDGEFCVTPMQLDAFLATRLPDDEPGPWDWSFEQLHAEIWSLYRPDSEDWVMPPFIEPSGWFWGRPICAWDALCREISDQTQKIRSWWSQFELTPFWSTLIKVTATAAAVGATCFAIYKWKNWRQIEESKYADALTRTRPVIRMGPSYKADLARHKPKLSIQQSSFVSSLWERNIAIVRLGDGERIFAMNGLFVKGTTLLTCYHLFAGQEDGAQLEVESCDGQVESFRYDSQRLVRIGPDVCLYRFTPQETHSRRDVSMFFTNETMCAHQMGAIASRYPHPIMNHGTVAVTSAFQYHLATQELIQYVRAYEMRGIALLGASGSPLVVSEEHCHTPRILGIQVAVDRNNGVTYIASVTPKDLAEGLAKLGVTSIVQSNGFEDDDDDEYFDALPVPESLDPEYKNLCVKSLRFVGMAERPVPQPGRTSLRQSRIHTTFEKDPELQLHEPAVLWAHDENVLVKSMSGFAREYGTVDPTILKDAVLSFIDEDRIMRTSVHTQATLLTPDEILNGNKGRGLKGVELGTSPGLPLLFEKDGLAGKRRWIQMDVQGVRTMEPNLWTQMHKMEEALAMGVDPKVMAYACLKDELRTQEKCRARKTRSFIVLPMMYNLITRKYFGNFIAVQHQKVGKISSCVGIDVNRNWTKLAERLLQKGEDIEDFDYSDWDRSLHRDWFFAYADRVNAWYGDKPDSRNARIRKSLMKVLVDTNVQVGPIVVRTSGGNKSGCAITAEINTDIHDMLAYYVYCLICRDTGRKSLATLSEFRERVALALYGDDMVKSTRGDTTSWYNGTTMEPYIKELGMVITPGDKVSTSFVIKRLKDVTFLKRKFLTFDDDCGLVRAPLDKSVIQRMTLWVHKSNDNITATAENVRGAIQESFYWGKDYSETFRTKCLSAWCRAGLPMEQLQGVPTYHDLWRNWLDGGTGEMPGRFQFTCGDLGEEVPTE